MSTGLRIAKLALPAAVILLSACAGKPRENGEAGEKVGKAKMAALNSTWAGKPYKELVAAYGQPSMIMEVPYARQKTSVVIYPTLDKVTAKCQHAFTVVHGKEPMVQNYHCQ